MRIIVTGGLGFIGSALIRKIIRTTNHSILNIDSKTEISMPESIEDCASSKNYNFIHCDIKNLDSLKKIFNDFKPQSIIHLAAESHVDTSIVNPRKFLDSNVIGTFNLLHTSVEYLNKNSELNNEFRFLHVSTDEVFGSLDNNENSFSETSRYKPNSPYSASKASSDHFVRAWNKTYGLKTIITNCSNNYGIWQFPEKLIPVVIAKCLKKESIPIYGNGTNIRDWIYVEDHILALLKILKYGKFSETYNIGANQEISNIELVKRICSIFDEYYPDNSSFQDLIQFVKDRPGHDFRYSINSKKLNEDLNFKPQHTLDSGLKLTIDWYIKNKSWLFEKSSKKI